LTKRPLILALALGAACAPACGGSDTETTSGGPPALRLIATTGVAIKEIALYQAVKRPLMVGGMPATSDIPIVAGRDALIRVFLEVDESHEVLGRIYLDDDPTPIEVKQTIALTSTDKKLDSTLDFDIPGAKLTRTTKYRLAVGEMELNPTNNPDAPTYPATGTDPIPAESVGETLKIVLAPISYKGAVPDLTPDLIKQYTDGFYAMYPVPKVEVTVRAEPIVWTQTVSPNGAGWDTLLDHVAKVRLDDKVGKDVYYFAPLTPTKNFGQFCGGGCVAGLGLLGSPSDSYSRAAIGLGYGDPDSIVTALHETGHNHGRNHAPCDVPDADPKYPHDGGEDGVWGYNLLTKELFEPTITDVMGYCTPVWISDYTFTGLFNRIKLVNGVKRVIVPEAERNRLYDRALVSADGSVQWLSSLRLEEPPTAEETLIEVESADLTETVKGSFYRFDHLEGGIAFWPATERKTRAIRLDVGAGKRVRLSR
jgi:Peptidase M66